MLTFLSVAFLIYGTLHLYALSKLWLVLPHSMGWAIVLLLAAIVLTLSPLLLWQLSRLNWHGASLVASWFTYLWMGFIFLFCCTALAFDVGHLLALLFGAKWPLSASTALSAIGLLAFAMLGYGFIEARQIQVEQVKITTPKLSPAIGRVTIAQISDLHLGIMLGDAFLERVTAQLQALQPDIIVATGDIIDGHGDSLNALAQRLHTLQPPKGLYAVLGNHEYFIGLENALGFLRNAGFTVLRGEAAQTGGIVLVGVDDDHAGSHGEEVRADTTKALSTVPKGSYTILLKHQPVVEGNTPFDLQLSGHIHGGQIWPFGLLTKLSYHVSTGLTQLADGRQLYVSRGTGTWGPPIRLFAAPEITLITIESKPKQ